MVLIEPEPEAEETVRPSSPPPPAARAEEVEEAFEDALPEEQLREKARSQANDAKVEGNKLFTAVQYEDALSQYEIALQIAAELESAEDIRSACHSNRAVCYGRGTKSGFSIESRLKSFWKDKTGDVFLASQIHAGINRFQIDMTKYPILARLHDAYMEIPTFQASLSQNQPDAASS